MHGQLRLFWLGALLFIASCRDLNLPDPPPVLPGAVFGRVVVAVPGQTERVAARGATVALLGSSLAVTTGDNGNFALTGINHSNGKILVRYTEGARTRQKLISLAEIGAGPNRQVSLGDVLVAENASIRGKVLRSELAMVPSGHRDTVVFVPEGPFVAYSADDGSFSFDQLPEGSIELGFFRSGYQPIVLPALQLRGGEQLTLREVVLQQDGDMRPGSITGSVAFVPELADASGTTVSASGGGVSRNGTITAAGTLVIDALPAGLYSVQVSRSQYTSAVVHNVLVVAGTATSLAPIVLTQGAGFDAGVPMPLPDGGPTDAGADAGTDAGSDAGFDAGVDAGFDAGSDAGAGDAGPSACTTTPQCGLGTWCDNGFCVPLCTAGSCSGGRFCDVNTFTCLTPCGGGCDAGLTCDLSVNACRALCDGSLRCAAGLYCNPATSACEPECSMTRACPMFKTCNAGACINNGQCALDTDCGRDFLCVGGNCAMRTTTKTDAGWTCAGACDCRGDELCRADAGLCSITQHPTYFFAPDAGGTGDAPSSPSGSMALLTSRAVAPELIAMLSDGGTLLPNTISLDAGVTLSGGYVDCGPTRWVRDESQVTQLQSSATVLFRVVGSMPAPRSDITLRNLELIQRSGAAPTTLVDVDNAQRFTLENISILLRDNGSVLVTPLDFQSCGDVRLRNVSLNPSSDSVNAPIVLLSLNDSSGTIDGFVMPDTQQSASYMFAAISVTSLSGPFRLTNSKLGSIRGTTIVNEGLVRIESCNAFAALIDRNSFRWPNTAAGVQRLLRVAGCANASVLGNTFGDPGQVVQLTPASSNGAHAVYFDNSSGEIADNVVTFPASTNAGAAFGFDLRGPNATIDFHDNIVDGGTGLSFAMALTARNVAVGPLEIHDNSFDVSGFNAYGIDLININGGARMRIRDNFVRVTGNTVNAATALALNSVTGLIERNELIAVRGGTTRGFFSQGSNVTELYQNIISVGPGYQGGNFGVSMAGTGNTYAIGNSIDVRPDVMQGSGAAGLQCGSGQGNTFISNIIGVSGVFPVVVVENNGTNVCLTTTTFTRNYLFHGSGGVTAFDVSQSVGMSNGNQYGGTIVPYASTSTFELRDGGWIDQGAAGPQYDGGFATLDARRRPRVVGAGADIGALEKQ